MIAGVWKQASLGVDLLNILDACDKVISKVVADDLMPDIAVPEYPQLTLNSIRAIKHRLTDVIDTLTAYDSAVELVASFSERLDAAEKAGQDHVKFFTVSSGEGVYHRDARTIIKGVLG